ncbi:MAG: hypothetical protein A3D31_05255 [Candidatus Fluviicola riflensis]|nr:MAG: hypothetical protein CHH17_09760 [Candidatus Fluviicola riflensis]OGS79377.1 MAG: hypothetical protein A3D31_05255 [Candidatus Fluviicola riflensis]OGS86809.1 MAG: hypothetical protein A2724_04715 [Fluviicola sp. RIFCSPHIGHO2_01_FULL_43_53]OGS89599.1 MAG: hypothetical protein A3E30_01460 [Fluviicola sp. RIFCSPHIGHO2_12_FULL_43_24]
MGARFQVNVTNNSTQSTTMILFQKVPDQDWFQGLSVVWKSQRLSPGSKAIFDWSRDFCFVAANTGQLKPGLRFNTDSILSADPNERNNAATLEANGGNCQFSIGQGGQPGKLTIVTSNSIPMQPQFSAGIGMSDAATVIGQARPGMNYQFSADVEYWVAFGNYENGQVLSQNVVNAARISFPNGVTNMKVVLNQDNSYTINPA